MKLLFIFLFLISPNFAFCAGKIKSQKPRPQLETEKNADTLIRIVADDGESFFLSENKSNGKKIPRLGYARGQNTLMSHILFPERWNAWKSKFVQMVDRFPASEYCPHPTSFIIKKKSQPEKQKDFCENSLTDKERKELRALLTDWKKYLYE